MTWAATLALGALALGRPHLARAFAGALVATVGIAHGATDDAMLERIGLRPPGGRRALSVAYGALAAATYALARHHPKAAARALYALAWLHFGAGDAAFARACGSSAFGRGATFVRGGIPLCIEGRTASSTATFALALVAAARHAGEGAYADALDLALPATLLYAVPAGPQRLGFAIYFGAWHAPRHLALVLARDPRGGTMPARLRRFARESARNVALALAAAVLAVKVGPAGAGDDTLFAAMILAITVPHQLAVWLLEREARAKLGRRAPARS